jgi:hypothetical protein
MADAGDEREIDTGVTRSTTTRHANPRSGPAQRSAVEHEDNHPHRDLAKQPIATMPSFTPV